MREDYRIMGLCLMLVVDRRATLKDKKSDMLDYIWIPVIMGPISDTRFRISFLWRYSGPDSPDDLDSSCSLLCHVSALQKEGLPSGMPNHRRAPSLSFLLLSSDAMQMRYSVDLLDSGLKLSSTLRTNRTNR